jgi:hypothetical protein
MTRLMALLAGTLLLGLTPLMAADFLKAVDPSRMADINSKDADLNEVDLQTVSKPTRSTPISPISGKAYDARDVTLNENALKTVRFNTVPVTDVPNQNFSAKRAQADTNIRREKEVKKEAAAIKDRQIRAFTPKGEQELKDQLNLRY